MADDKKTPSVKFNFIDEIEQSGAKKGFIKLVQQGMYSDAKYNNSGRFQFKTGQIVVLNRGTPRTVPYEEYLADPSKFPEIQTTKYGILGLTSIVDFDTKQELTLWVGTNPKNTKELSWFADAIQRALKQHGHENSVFEIGKHKVKGKTQATFFIKYLGTPEDVLLLEDPKGSSQKRQDSLFESQELPPKVPEIQNFVLNEDEKYVMDQINELVTTKNVEVTPDRLQSTFENGFRGKKTSKERAAFIATNAPALGFKGILTVK